MEKKIIKGNQSNLQVDINLTDEDYSKIRENTLKEFGKDIEVHGYRKGNAPLSEIEKKVNPQYLETAIYENAINTVLKEVNQDYKLIGQIYDVNPLKDDNKKGISFKIDIYPTVEVLNDDYKNVSPYFPNYEITKEDKAAAREGLQRQFAEYKDVEKIDTELCFVKLDLEYLDKDGNKVGDGKVFLTKEDFKEFPNLETIFKDKKVGFDNVFDYTADLPQLLKYFKKDAKNLEIFQVKAIVAEIKQPELPEITIENLEKWFGKKYNKIEEFDEEINNALSSEKEKNELVKFIDDLVEKISPSFDVQIPKTLIDQETQQRFEVLKRQYGGEENFEKMLKGMENDELQKVYQDISSASKVSIKKFFALMKYAELNGLSDKIDFEKDFDLEKKLLALFKKKSK